MSFPNYIYKYTLIGAMIYDCMIILFFLLSVCEFLITGNALDYSEAYFKDIDYNFMVAAI